MKQFSVKNDHAAELLEAITHLTGKGNEVIVSALEKRTKPSCCVQTTRREL